MCFQNAIGIHINGSGLIEAWFESGPNATEHVMNGKAYKRAMRAVAAADASSARILPEIVPRSLPISDLACSPENPGALITLLKSPRVKKMLDEFVAQRSEENGNFKFWWNYMEMASILLMFTCPQREGKWDL